MVSALPKQTVEFLSLKPEKDDETEKRKRKQKNINVIQLLPCCNALKFICVLIVIVDYQRLEYAVKNTER